MTHWTEAADLLDERADAEPGLVARYAPGAFAFVMSAALGVYLVYLRPILSAPAPQAPADIAAKAEVDPFGALAPLNPPPAVAVVAKQSVNPFGGIVTSGFGTSARVSIAEAAIPTPPAPPSDLRQTDEIAIPLPPRRPSLIARTNDDESDVPTPPSVARVEPRPSAAAPGNAAPAPATGQGVFEKLFGTATSKSAKAPETQMAYAEPPPSAAVSASLASRNGMGGSSGSGGGFGGFLRGLNFGGGGGSPASRFGDHVAVYDISARMVYLPDGTKLEAHSGLGVSRDDPGSVNQKMRGATPPATYALTPREELFHGVAALRLTPVDGSVFGRVGLLAHTYMLGAEGDSNGCVSFRDYDAFLRAYRSGQITKLVVVTRL